MDRLREIRDPNREALGMRRETLGSRMVRARVGNWSRVDPLNENQIRQLASTTTAHLLSTLVYASDVNDRPMLETLVKLLRERVMPWVPPQDQEEPT